MYAGDGELTELREAIEAGRKHKIAAEVFGDFLDSRRAEIVRALEDKPKAEDYVINALAELRVMKQFRRVIENMIQLGEIAEERMNEIGG